MKRAILILLAASATPAFAQSDPLAPISQPAPVPAKPQPILEPAPIFQPVPPPAPVRPIPRDWRGVFDAIRYQDWGGASAAIATLPESPLKAVARAELFTAKNSPRAELGPILSLLAEAPDLPHAEQLQRLAVARGAVETPPVIYGRQVIGLGSAPRRTRARSISGEPGADALMAALEPFVDANDAPNAEALLFAQGPMLSSEARAQAGQRVAWIYYVLGRDADVRRVADQWRSGAVGEWGAQSAWVSGLAAWRMGDCNSGQAAFRDAMRMGAEREFVAAAAYWGARSAQSCRRPREVQGLLLAAARSPESFYGLLARETLGMETKLPAPRRFDRNSSLARSNNVRRATELVAIGEVALAEQMIRHQARIGAPAEHGDLIAVARELDLAGAQYWLAHNGQRGVRVDAADRYPAPRWAPERGWRIDPALAFGHARQESDFRHAAISPAGAVGLMQVRPGTAGDFARARGTGVGNLSDPRVNLEYGQSYIELVRRNPATQGQLLKVMAAYNAGPVPVSRWNYINDKGDPLLWTESLSYWETRYYVPTVLRNMWVYQGLAGAEQSALRALAEHRWPAFPTTTTQLAR
ncbi:MAG: lytic transglycosylase domain-containing protein [Pseudomonadota bacterium]|nr:lytic transglycosylase domain-containing protein [Pseudomonadota bacterium]